METHQFKYRGKTYECIGDDKDFQIEQFNFLLKTGDYPTLENRIVNQTIAWDCLIEVPVDGIMTKEDVGIVKKEINKKKFW